MYSTPRDGNSTMGGHPGTQLELAPIVSLLDVNPFTFVIGKQCALSLATRLDISMFDAVEDSILEISNMLLDQFNESTTVYGVVPELYRDVVKWITISAFAERLPARQIPTGRRELRERISHCLKAEEDIPMFSKAPEVKAETKTVLASSDTPIDIKVESTVSAIQHVKTAAHAAQLVKTSGIMCFDGLNNPERYLLFKFDISELTLGSGFSSNKLLSMEILLAAVRGVPLSNLRRLIGERDLYSSPSTGLSILWESLDLLYKTPEAIRFIMENYSSCKQGNSESLAAYIARFKRLAEAKRSLGALIGDSDLISQFSCGLSSSVNLLARGMCDPMAITSFDQYTLQITTVSRSLEPLIRSNGISNNYIKHDRKAFCTKCGDPTHAVAECKRRVKYECKYCKTLDHFSSVCPQQRSHPKNEQKSHPKNEQKQNMRNNLLAVAECSDSYSTDDRVHNSVIRISTTNSIAKIGLNAIGLNDSRLVDPDEPLGLLEIQGNGVIQENCLYDTGAGANFIHQQLATSLIRNGSIKKSGIIDIPHPIKVTYGNSDFEYADCYVVMKIRKNPTSPWMEILCLVTHNCSYPFILGRTGLKQLNLMQNTVTTTHLSCATTKIAHIIPEVQEPPDWSIVTYPTGHSISMGEIVQLHSLPEDRPPLIRVTDDLRLMIQFALLEKAHILPYRAPRRNRSLIDLQLIKAKLDQMISEDKVEYCESRDCHMLHEIVLVDKKADERLARVFPDNLKRYRVTLDLRVGNDLELVDIGETNALVPNKYATKVKPTKTLYDHQYQTGAIEILRGLPAGARVYAKIDLDDAFQSVLLPAALRSLFCCVCQTASGPVYYRWKSLPQGWKWSPLFFQIAVQYVLDQVRPHLHSQIDVRHYQDDILIQGPSEEVVSQANELIGQKFLHFGFRVNTAKCTIGASTVFCGYHLSANGIKPAPKEPITHHFVNNSWNKFEAASLEERLTLLRAWSGKFNYFVGFLPAAQLASLRYLYSASGKKLSANESFDMGALFEAFQDLCNFILDGHISTFPIGRVPNAVCSVVVTDANANSYCGILLRICFTSPDSPSTPLPEFRPLLTLISLELDLGLEPDALMVIPMRICGGTFTPGEQKQSSTYRERLCQLRAIDQFYSLISGRCLVVSDNQNVGRTWHNVDETLSYGSNLVPWQRFISIVHTTLWLPRDDPLMSLVDFGARLLDPTFNTTSPPKVRLAAAQLTSGATPPEHAGPRRYAAPELAMPLRDAIIDAYLQDSSTYLGVSMLNLYHHLVHGSRVDTKTANLSARFVYQDGFLLHLRSSGDVQIYIPTGGALDLYSEESSTIRATLLHHYHDSITGLHRGYRHLVRTLSDVVWWPTLLADSLTYVKTCRTCQISKTRFTPFQGELRSIQASQPVQHWVVDYAGPMKNTDNRFVLVAMCVFSSYAILIPTHSSTAENTANLILERIVSQFGIPESIYSDRGAQFNSEIIRDLNKLLGIKWRLSSSYSPRTQGLAERMIQSMKKILECMDFDHSCIPLIQLLHNTSYVAGLPITPFEAIYGFAPNISPLIHSTANADSFIAQSEDRTELLHDIRSSWSTFKTLMRERTNDIYCSRSKVSEFAVGDQVMRTFVTDKYRSDRIKTTGPHNVLEKHSINQYIISGYVYPIPHYQLHVVEERPDHLSVSRDRPVADSPSPLVAGTLVIFEAFEDTYVAYDVAEVLECTNGVVRAVRYWFDASDRWHRWDGEIILFDVSQVRASGFVLSNGKIPAELKRTLLK